MKTISCLIAAMFIVSCHSLHCEGVTGSGKVTQKTYDVANFKEVDLSVVFDVVIIPSDNEKVVVETDDNLQNLLIIENDNNSLAIKMKPETNISRKTKGKITIYAKELSEITNSSVATLENQGVLNSKKLILNNSAVGNANLKINTSDLTINNSGVGNTDIDGSCDNLKIQNSAVGNFDASDLKCKHLDIDNRAVGNTKVYAYEDIAINNSAIGKLDVYGDCVIKKISNNAVGKFVKH